MIRRFLEWLTATILPAPRVIFDRAGKTPYLSRWYLLGGARDTEGGSAFDATGNPKTTTEFAFPINVYLHKFHRGDDDDSPHCHPWKWSFSILLSGGYIEHRLVAIGDTEMRSRRVVPPMINIIRGNDFHRVDLIE
jgi:hypothetical protein